MIPDGQRGAAMPMTDRPTDRASVRSAHRSTRVSAMAALLALLALAASGLTAAEAPGRLPGAGQLGAADVLPTSEHPFGWRGDGSGLYPGARPPTSWSRTISGSAVTRATYQGPKPKGDGPSSDAAPLELGMVKDWLVIGPFAADDPAKDIEKPFLGDEAAVRPDENAKVGALSWKRLRVSMDTQSSHNTNGGICNEQNVDFTYIYGRLANQVAYAHTYLYSPSGGPAQLAIHHADRSDAQAKIWLNGAPTLLDPKAAYGVHQAKVTLEKGWNRLLVKVSCAASATQDPYNAHSWDPEVNCPNYSILS